MKSFKLHHKIIAVVIAFFFAFQSMPQINDHTYTTGFSNFHYSCPDGMFCCFGIPLSHTSYDCGKPFHIR